MTGEPNNPNNGQRRFHLAFCVDDLDAAREFYRDILGCRIGRTADRWIDFDLFGNQITAHLVDRQDDAQPTNPVDGDRVPVPHFGAILEWTEWEALVGRLQSHGLETIIGPRVRFKGQPGEQGTVFVRDPAGNTLEFKCFREDAAIFATGR